MLSPIAESQYAAATKFSSVELALCTNLTLSVLPSQDISVSSRSEGIKNFIVFMLLVYDKHINSRAAHYEVRYDLS